MEYDEGNPLLERVRTGLLFWDKSKGKRMKKAGFITIAVLIFAVSMSLGGAKRITDYSGNTAVSLGPAVDSQTFVTNKMILTPRNTSRPVIYDKLFGSIHMSPMTGATGVGDLDSVVFMVIASKGYWVDTLLRDSFLPSATAGTFNFSIYRGQVTIIDSSDAGVALEDKADTTYQALMLDDIHLSIYVMDSSGTDPNDTAIGTVNWWLRLIEED